MPTTVAIAASSSGDNEIVAAVTGPSRKIRVLAFHLSFGGTVNAKWKSGASTDKTGLLYGILGTQLPARAHEAPSQHSPPFIFETAAGEALNLNLSGAVAVGGWVTYDLVGASQ